MALDLVSLDTGFPFDAPQTPAQSPQGYDLLLLILTQDIAHARTLMLYSINVLAQFSMAGFDVTHMAGFG